MECEYCKEQEVKKLREDLLKCQKNSKSKDMKLKVLNKRIFICTIIGVAIAAIFGKEALDAITEWLGSVNGFRHQILSDNGAVYPSPGTLGVFAVAALIGRPRRRR
tara:strand:+ start:194 stop:511 length:318 start_codon:yes stop_codon:yes gene_type:complete